MSKQIKHKKLWSALALILLSGSAMAQQKITVQEAVDRALQNNLQIKQTEFQMSIAEQDVLQARMNFYPTLNAGGNWGQSWGLSFDQTAGRLVTQSVNSAGLRVSSSFDLFQGFQKINTVKANKYSLLASESNVERAKNDLTLSVLTTYLEALTNYDMMLASQDQVKLSQEQLRVMEINVEAGNRTLADLYQAQNQVATDEFNVTTSENAYELAILNLKQLMEMDPNVEIVLDRPNIESIKLSSNPAIASDIFNTAVSRLPEIKAAEFQTKVAETNIDIARAGYYPSLSFSAGIGTNYSSQARDFVSQQILPFGDQIERNRNESIGVNLSIPIFNNYRTRISVRKAKINYLNAQTNEQLAKNNLNKVINQAVLDLRSAEKRLYSAEVATQAANQAYEVMKLRYDEGMTNSVELNTTLIAKNRAEFEYIQAKYNLVFRNKLIDFYLGNPIQL